MRRLSLLIVVAVILVAVPLLAGRGNKEVPSKEDPARVEEIPGSEFKRVVVTEKAAERLDIQTVPVSEEPIVRTRMVGGQVVALPEGEASDAGPVWARVSLTQNDLAQLDLSQPALVRALDADDEEDQGWPAEPDEMPNGDDAEDVDLPGEDLAEQLYYRMTSQDYALAAGQAVLVELPLSAREPEHKVVPYAAVLYGVHGETWVYTNPEPLVFVRQPIVIDYIEGDVAILTEGPQVGTAVVTVGAAELFGTETGVSK